MKCPYCAEEIKKNAIVCKHCHRDLTFYMPVANQIEELNIRLDGLENRLIKMQQFLVDTDYAKHVKIDSSKPISFYFSTIIICCIVSIATYAYFFASPAIRQWILLISIFTPAIGGVWIGFFSGERTVQNMLVVGAINGLIVSIGVAMVVMLNGRHVDWIAVFTLYFLPPSLLVIFGGVIGEWLAQVAGRRQTDPLYARSIAALIVGQSSMKNDLAKEKQVEKFSGFISAFAPILTFIASILGAWLTYLSATGK